MYIFDLKSYSLFFFRVLLIIASLGMGIVATLDTYKESETFKFARIALVSMNYTSYPKTSVSRTLKNMSVKSFLDALCHLTK